MVFTHMARTFRRYEPDQMLMRRIAAKLQESAAFRFLAPHTAPRPPRPATPSRFFQ